MLTIMKKISKKIPKIALAVVGINSRVSKSYRMNLNDSVHPVMNFNPDCLVKADKVRSVLVTIAGLRSLRRGGYCVECLAVGGLNDMVINAKLSRVPPNTPSISLTLPPEVSILPTVGHPITLPVLKIELGHVGPILNVHSRKPAKVESVKLSDDQRLAVDTANLDHAMFEFKKLYGPWLTVDWLVKQLATVNAFINHQP